MTPLQQRPARRPAPSPRLAALRAARAGRLLELPLLLLLLRAATPAVTAAVPAAAAGSHPKTSPRITAAWKGQESYSFPEPEPHTVLYHELGSDSVMVGGRGKLYHFDFIQGKNASLRTVYFDANKLFCQNQLDCENYITLLEKQREGLLICGTNARHPSCWNLTNKTITPLGEKRGYAPFSPDENSLVLFSDDQVYSTIRKQEYNGKIPRFRRIGGERELYTSDMVMQNPQFIKATIINQDEAYDDKIYYFFRENNPDKNPEAPMNVSRVAQLCKGDRGGVSSMSASKWNTFLKAMLVCSDPATNKNFNWLQDVFLVPDATGDWRSTKVYGVFSNPWNYSAICVYSIGDIDRIFRTSPLKGYSGTLPNPRPGKCLPDEQLTPTETFQVADSHPEVAQRVEPFGAKKTPLFHSKYHYKKVLVHQMLARNGSTFNVLYLATDKGTIHKVVESDHGAFNIMEIQPFRQHPATIQSMTLDNVTMKLYVNSQWEVSQVPLDLCSEYRGGCQGCLMARDPYCGWDDTNGQCVSIYKYKGPVLQSLGPNEPHTECPSSKLEKGSGEAQSVTLARNSRYYLTCPVESHHATYSWHHGDKKVHRCEPGWQNSDCILFIEKLTDEQYGLYRCKAEEGTYSRIAVQWELRKEATAEHLLMGGSVGGPGASLCLRLLFALAIFLLFQ
ncbi:semaphorin-7A [Trichosurus vulpecula]|uniref:semaphorin-7A n=1 Tax=Trichosurus vulpecula TaxID=9337 RepID=UPI00186AEBC7|nr:semaphorin-7A [Trichosurus vulpecula]